MSACSVCAKPSIARGLCKTHYYRLRRNGTTDATRCKTDAERFAKFTIVDESTGCWNWTGARTRGYAWMGQRGPAHRISFQTFVGEIPSGKRIDHICRNPLCVNPHHLRPVTPAENSINSLSVRGSHSRFRGVGREGRRWRARIRIDGRAIYLGSFVTEEEAAAAWRTAAIEKYPHLVPEELNRV